MGADQFKQEVIDMLHIVTKLEQEQIEKLIEVPKADFGDFAFPCFILSKELRKAPNQIATDLAESIKPTGSIEKIQAVGPYINFYINSTSIIKDTLTKVSVQKDCFGLHEKKDKLVLVESPGPNTNKPLHLGHLRNMLLGQAITNILRAYGKDVKIVNVLNDRGVHICKSMLAYQKFGEGKTPESENRKSDHFVGDYYVEFAKQEKKHPELEQETQDMLLKWEQNDPEIRALWQKMNTWATDGFAKTYEELNYEIDKDYLESNTYLGGKKIVEQGLIDGLFQKDEKGAIVVDLTDKGLDTKVLLRSNGTTVYITQDLEMANLRSKDYKFDEMIYIVGNEQEYHFKVLFEIFKKLGWSFGEYCKHFSYGMVELPEGKMKSREGTVIDADDLIKTVKQLAHDEVSNRYSDLSKEEINNRSRVIGMSALRFFFMKYDPLRDFVYNPKESFSFEGETGPYTQYVYARISSIIRKSDQVVDSNINFDNLSTSVEKELAIKMSEFSTVIETAANSLKTHHIARFALELAQKFNEFYSQNKVITEDAELTKARLFLIDCVRQVIKNALKLLEIEVLEQM